MHIFQLIKKKEKRKKNGGNMKGEINIHKGNKRVKGSWREIGGKVVYSLYSGILKSGKSGVKILR